MKKGILRVGLFVVLFMMGCGQAEPIENPATPQNENISDLFEIVEEPVIEIPENGEMTGNQIVIEKKDAGELAKYNASNRLRCTDTNENQQSLFCIDPDTGVVYFVNQNKDWYIYRLQNDKMELAVELPARELYMWDGTLYFLVEDYDKYDLSGISENSIYAYTPAEGKVELFYNAEKKLEVANESHLGVGAEGVYLFWNEQGEEVVHNGRKGYRLNNYYSLIPFETREPVEDPNCNAIAGWKEYYHRGGSMFSSRETGESLDVGVPAQQSCVIDDIFYSVDTGQIVFYMTDMLTGEVKCFDCKPVLEDVVLGGLDRGMEGIQWVQSFSVTKEYIWVVVQGSYLVQIEPESGSIVCYNTRLKEEKPEDDEQEDTKKVVIPYSHIDKLYTDGENLYALCALRTTGAPEVIVKINTNQNMDLLSIDKVPILAIEELKESEKGN